MSLLLAAVGLSGCAIRIEREVFNKPILPSEVRFIAPGRTTVDEVVERFGAPQEILGTEDRLIFRYAFVESRKTYINFGQLLGLATGARFTPELSTAKRSSGADTFQVTFDRQWVAGDFSFQRGTEASRFNPWPF